MAFAHALKIALAAGAGLDMLHVSEQRDLGWTDFPGVRGTLERWQLLPPNSPRKAVASLGIDVRKVVMKDSDAVRAAEVELDGGRFAFAALQVLKCGVDFLLRKLAAQ